MLYLSWIPSSFHFTPQKTGTAVGTVLADRRRFAGGGVPAWSIESLASSHPRAVARSHEGHTDHGDVGRLCWACTPHQYLQ